MEKIGTFEDKDVVLGDEDSVCDCGTVTRWRLIDPTTTEMWVCCSHCLQGVMDENERRRHIQDGMKNCATIALGAVLFFIAILILAYLGKI